MPPLLALASCREDRRGLILPVLADFIQGVGELHNCLCSPALTREQECAAAAVLSGLSKCHDRWQRARQVPSRAPSSVLTGSVKSATVATASIFDSEVSQLSVLPANAPKSANGSFTYQDTFQTIFFFFFSFFFSGLCGERDCM